jgi:hypothetical protein
MQPSMQFTYRLPDAQLILEIEEAGMQTPEEMITPIVLFNSTFMRKVNKTHSPSEKKAWLGQIIDLWQQDLATYQNIVHTHFLSLSNAAVPNLIQFPEVAI